MIAFLPSLSCLRTLPYTVPALFHIHGLFSFYCMHTCVCIHLCIPKYNLFSASNVTCIYTFRADRDWATNWYAFPWRRPPFCSQLSSVTFSCLYKVEPSLLIFLNNLYADFQSGWTSLHSYQQCLNLASIFCHFLDDCQSDCGKIASW